jgi:hypothetical protein
MAVATFKPIAEVLARAGVTRPLAGGYWRFDVKRYLELVTKDTRWNQLPGNKVYAANRSMLIASTDVRTSNSAAMYLAFASYVRNGDRVVENAGQATASSISSRRCSCARATRSTPARAPSRTT